MKIGDTAWFVLRDSRFLIKRGIDRNFFKVVRCKIMGAEFSVVNGLPGITRYTASYKTGRVCGFKMHETKESAQSEMLKRICEDIVALRARVIHRVKAIKELNSEIARQELCKRRIK